MQWHFFFSTMDKVAALTLFMREGVVCEQLLRVGYEEGTAWEFLTKMKLFEYQ